MEETHYEIRRISAWSAVKITAAVGFIGFLVWVAAVGIIYFLTATLGLLTPISELIGGEDAISAALVLGMAAGLGALWWLLSVGLAGLGVVVYNACAGLVGGLKISLHDV